MQKVGFLRVGARDFYPIIICNDMIISDACRNFLEKAIKVGYKFHGDYIEQGDVIDEYQERFGINK